MIRKREETRSNDDNEEGDEVCKLAKTLVMESEAPWASFFTGALTSATPSKASFYSLSNSILKASALSFGD